MSKMEDFEQYWILYPLKFKEHEKFVQNAFAGQHHPHYKKTFVEEFFKEQLNERPYPTIQILQAMSAKYNLSYNFVFEILLKNLNKDIPKFFNMLVNMEISQDLENFFESYLLPKIKVSENVYLSLLARSDNFKLLKKFLEYHMKTSCECSKFMLKKALYQNEHIFYDFENRNPNQIICGKLEMNAFSIIQIINQFDKEESIIAHSEKFYNILKNIDKTTLSRSIEKTFHYDFCRIQNIIKFIEKYNTDISSKCIHTIQNTNSIVDLLAENMDLSVLDYDEIRLIVEKNLELSKSIISGNVQNLEMNVLTSFFILKYLTDILLMKTNCNESEISIERNLLKIQKILRKIKDIDKFSKIIEDIFKMLFLRWESVPSSLIRNASSIDFIDVESYTDVGTDISIAAAKVTHEPKKGFICTKFQLDKILKFLKQEITRRLHTTDYQNATDMVRDRYLTIADIINNSLWRISLFEKLHNENDPPAGCITNSNDMLDLIELHIGLREKTSSDDDDSVVGQGKDVKNSIIRRKPRKRNSLSRIHCILDKNIEKRTVKKDCGIIAKMLGTPDNLASVCLSIDDFNSARQIIQTFNLKNKSLENEINFLENFEQTKKKLHTIFEKYQIQESLAKETTSTIEEIKKLAGIGFEASKITNILQKFAQTNQLNLNSESVYLIEKYSNQYKFLQQYKPGPIQATVIFDLIINLANNYDITYNIYNMTDRNYGNNIFTEENQQQHDQHQDIGCLTFLKNLVECMNHYKNFNSENLSIKYVLNDTYYSLKSQQLKIDIEREKIFSQLYSLMEFEDIRDLRKRSKLFDDLKSTCNYFNRFIGYLLHFQQLLHMRDNSHTKLSITELMMIDPKQIIGELIFEKKMTPLEIENIVTSLNLNLVHVIALNTCPEILQTGKLCSILSNKEENVIKRFKFENVSIYNYIKSHNSLLSFLIQQINDTKCESTFKNDLYFKRALALPEMEYMSSLFDLNLAITVLLSDYVNHGKICVMPDKSFHIICTIEETYKYPTLLKVIKDEMCNSIVTKDSMQISLIENITDINLCAKLLCDNIMSMNDTIIIKRLIQYITLHKNAKQLNINLKHKLEQHLENIDIFSKLCSILNLYSWKSAYDISMKRADVVVKKLIEIKDYRTFYIWSKCIVLPTKFEKSQKKILFEQFFDCLSETNETGNEPINPYLLKLIESFPQDLVNQFYENNLDKFKNFVVLSYVVKYLKKSNSNFDEKFRNYEVSIKIFKYMTMEERERNWNLISRPLLLIEQFVMNSKFELFSKILECILPILGVRNCKFCYDKRGNIYEMPMNSSITLGGGSSTSSEFILLNFDLYQKDHIITVECIDSILRIYATRALDYHVNVTYSSSTELLSQSTDLTSLDSLCGTFIMPKEAPIKEEWIKDEEAINCMCCKRAKFTMLTRRHHCRRCGRVICGACSLNRLKIPNIYEEILVRVCDDCFKQTETLDKKTNQKHLGDGSGGSRRDPTKYRTYEESEWQFSGNLTHDKLLREEFCYEHAPSVGLCLTILSHHSKDTEYVNFLLYHCRKLEKVLRPIQPGFPNPEIDYILVAKMLNCLALAAKVRGGPVEFNTIRDHSDIIVSVVQNGFERLLPMDELNNYSLRKLGDSLVLAEKWNLALDIFLKCGFPTAGVLAAYGLSCLKAGCFDTAREKLSHCMTRISNEKDNAIILKNITNEIEIEIRNEIDIPIIKRPNRSPPLLEEIIKIIEVTSRTFQPETLTRASIIRDSNTSLTSTRSKRKENIPIHEPALNILNTLSSLKQITQGNYCDNTIRRKLDNKRFVFKNSRLFEECFHYLLSYGSHSDIINFLMAHDEILCALKYFIIQHLDNEIFVQNIYFKHLKCGRVDMLIKQLLEMDDTLLIWKEAILHTCRYLETRNLLNSLYHLQILLKDPIRASMTCVKFYSMNCCNFRDLQNNSFHLINAQKHLQSQLELYQWEDINDGRENINPEPSFLMQMSAKSLNVHINTILRQMEVTKLLSKCEQDGKQIMHILKQITVEVAGVPTLFDSIHEKIKLCILVLLCGEKIEDVFRLVYKIMHDYKIMSVKVYGPTTKYLAQNNRIAEVEKLITCIKSNNENNKQQMCDELLSLSIQSAANVHGPEVKAIIDNLIKLISDAETRIACHIFMGQLKSAYLLAVQYNRLNDVKKILRQAEATNQLHVKKLCEKKLNIK